jgi:hypothetical protein
MNPQSPSPECDIFLRKVTPKQIAGSIKEKQGSIPESENGSPPRKRTGGMREMWEPESSYVLALIIGFEKI